MHIYISNDQVLAIALLLKGCPLPSDYWLRDMPLSLNSIYYEQLHLILWAKYMPKQYILVSNPMNAKQPKELLRS